MLKLILLRHGKAANAIDGQEDYDRPLNRKGVVQINQIGQILKTQVNLPGQIISSKAKRTFQTTQVVNHYLKIPKVSYHEELYLAEAIFILNTIQENATEQSLLYVGHNFGISNLASIIGGKSISMTTGMVVSFNFDLHNWGQLKEGSGKLEKVYSPNIFLP